MIKLKAHYRNNGSILTQNKYFLNKRYQTVAIAGGGTPCMVLSGLPQGTVLAPLLFSTYLY